MEKLHSGEAGGAAHRQQTRHAGPKPAVELPGQFVRLVKLQRRKILTVFLPRVTVCDKGVDERYILSQAADDLQAEQRVFEVIQHAQEEHDVELSQAGLRQVEEIESTIGGLRAQRPMNLTEARQIDAVDGRDGSAAALSLEAEPAVPGADVENVLAPQVLGDWKAGVPLAQRLQADAAVDVRAAGELEAVEPALLGEPVGDVSPPPGQPYRLRVHRYRSTTLARPALPAAS